MSVHRVLNLCCSQSLEAGDTDRSSVRPFVFQRKTSESVNPLPSVLLLKGIALGHHTYSQFKTKELKVRKPGCISMVTSLITSFGHWLITESSANFPFIASFNAQHCPVQGGCYHYTLFAGMKSKAPRSSPAFSKAGKCQNQGSTEPALTEGPVT